jgi:hypothetical protein
MDGVPDLNAGKDKMLSRIGIVAGIALVIGGGYAGYRYLTYKPGGNACTRIAEIAKTDAEGAHAVVDHMVHYVEDHFVRGTDTPIRIGGDDDSARCNEVLKTMDEVMMHGQYQRLLECFASAPDAPAASLCI